jgi:hypothetical protein
MKQWKKGIATWAVGNTLYISVPFTWLMKDAEFIASQHKGKVLIGGSGTMTKTECDGFEPILFHNPCATFTTRGCINNCSFCAVPKLEGEFREVENFRPAPVICDNNILASHYKHFERVIDLSKNFPLVDFNQGLQASLLTQWHVDQIRRLHKVKVRFAFDHIGNETAVHDAVKLCQKNGLKDITILCLIGFNDTPEDAIYRLEKIKEWGCLPAPMRFQPLNTKCKNEYISPNWTDSKLKDVQRYYFRSAMKFGFDNYNPNIKHDQQVQLL